MPVFDFVSDYAEKNMLRCHMPGHKGRSIWGDFPEKIFSMDITEIKNADSLFESCETGGVIRRTEKNISDIYGSLDSFISTSGSTLCIQAMLTAVKLEKRRVIAVRNVHRSFINSCILLGIEPEWILPKYSDFAISGEIDTQVLENTETMLKKIPNACLYVTSPDYTGYIAPIDKLAEICHGYGAVLIVDNAHGAHLKFMEKSLHPISLGADMCCDSLHKMLPALTGSAVLHVSNKRYSPIAKHCMSIFGSTSPSYVIMSSIDRCMDYMRGNLRRDIENNLSWINDLRKKFDSSLFTPSGDPFHLSVNAGKYGFDGKIFAEILRECGVECEYSDSTLVILLLSPVFSSEDYIRLEKALESALKRIKDIKQRRAGESPKLPTEVPVKVMGMREAFFSESEEIPVGSAVGRVCAYAEVPCPPAVPIVAGGELIDRDTAEILRFYGVDTLKAVKL